MSKPDQPYSDGFWWSNDGLRLHFRDYPARPENAHRPPILCIPGLTRNARDFEQVAARLAGDWRVICVDLRGRGDSAYAKDAMSYVPLTYVQDMEALLRAEAIERFVAFGTSLGGLITMLLASTRPGRVVGALLNDVGPQLEPEGLARIRDYVGQGRSFPTWMHAARALSEAQGAVFPGYGVSEWLDLAKKTMKIGAGGRIVYDYDMKIAEPFAVPGGEAGVDLWPAMAGLSPAAVLIVRGALSDVFSEATAQRMLTMLPQGRLLTVENKGHAPTLEEPEVAAAIDDLLTRVDAAVLATHP
ncbi:alpha/beta fold hydrolase [Sphingomonas sp. 35-24ZXX]|uniref:alpha/beta fold hydrolase n=1 Tax=Sphingomonas sp. 35-24ZXX TaxID=1545915 RepID=UPI00053BF5D6|nr:alpha/beta hydrolase [Sphingomonas sp. 35-24ZXX]